jgi:serine/threonine protein kinase
VFSLGSVLYETLTGHNLFRVPNELETLRRVREAVVPPPSTYRADLDPRLDRIVLAMMARSPAERIASCDEVARSLRPFALEAGVDAAWIRDLLSGLELEGVEKIRSSERRETQTLMPGAPRSRAVWLWAALVTAAIAAPYAVPACNAPHSPPVVTTPGAAAP